MALVANMAALRPDCDGCLSTLMVRDAWLCHAFQHEVAPFVRQTSCIPCILNIDDSESQTGARLPAHARASRNVKSARPMPKNIRPRNGAGNASASSRRRSLARETKERTGKSLQVKLRLSDKAGRFEDSFFQISVGSAFIESLTCRDMFTNIKNVSRR